MERNVPGTLTERLRGINLACGTPHANALSSFIFKPTEHSAVILLNMRKYTVGAVLNPPAVSRRNIIRTSAAVLEAVERTKAEKAVHPFKLMTGVKLAA